MFLLRSRWKEGLKDEWALLLLVTFHFSVGWWSLISWILVIGDGDGDGDDGGDDDDGADDDADDGGGDDEVNELMNKWKK